MSEKDKTIQYGALDPQQRLDVARGVKPQASAAQSAPDEVFAIPVRENGKRTTFYTEVLPFVPDPGVEVLGEPVRMVAAQSAPDAHERWLSDPNNEPFPGGLSGIPMPALQSAPDEREGSEQ